jgi:hypothetical protein
MRAAARLALVCLLCLAAWPPGAAPARAAGAQTFSVNWLLDEPAAAPGSGVCISTPSAKCTLRAAVQVANASPGHDTILLGPGTHILTRPGADYDSLNGSLDIDSDLTLIGLGPSQTIIYMDGAATNQGVFETFLGGVVRFEGLTVSGGGGNGGGIINFTHLTLVNVVVRDNRAPTAPGGGISNFGHLSLLDSQVISNSTNSGGGGIINYGVITLTRSLIADNAAISITASLQGGGIFNHNTLTILDSQVRNNLADDGAGIYNQGSLTVAGSLISDNDAASIDFSRGGGIYNSGSLTVTRSTFSGNAVKSGGGGLANFGTARVDASSFYNNNSLGEGGAVANFFEASLLMHNSTLSTNRAGNTGSAIYNSASVNAYNVTIAFNRASVGKIPQGHEVALYQSSGAFNLRNSIVAGNYRVSGADVIVDDCHGLLGLYGREYFTPLAGTPDTFPCSHIGPGTVSVSASANLLAPLALNGGSTLSHWLLPGHPAIDGADPVHGCADAYALPLLTDQRGFARPYGLRCDSGAIENYLKLWLPNIRR